MPDDVEPISREQFEAYLDGTLDERQRDQVERALLKQPDLQAEVSLQEQIDVALKRTFPVAAMPADGVSTVRLSAEPASRPSPRWDRRVFVGGGVLAAGLAAVMLALWDPAGGGKPVPFFQPTPLALIYREAVRSGFEPYYECNDPARFAEVFRNRQGTELKLLPMPEGSRMLGLSYPGGLSRDTTAMLCEVDDKPVMVFVDRATADHPHAADAAEQEGLHVFREVRDGLVYYEVTPFAKTRALEFLVPAGGHD